MDNKLSELSKPVAYDYQYAGVQTCEGFGDWRNELTHDCPPEWMVEEGKVTGVKPLYSQGYVSALQQDAHISKRYALIAEKKLKECRARIAELEQVPTIKHMRSVEEALISATDRASELEQKLATPVRLPDIRSDDYHETGWFQHMKYYRDVERSLRAAGFTVGDE